MEDRPSVYTESGRVRNRKVNRLPPFEIPEDQIFFEQLAQLVEHLLLKYTEADLAKIFGRKGRRTISRYLSGMSFRLDPELLFGLQRLGYDIVLVKKR